MSVRDHDFARACNHNRHYYPLLRDLLPKSGHVVDIGCGEGTFARYAATAQRPVTGVDSDASVLPAPSGPTVFVRGRAEQVPLPDCYADAVTAIMVLHHTDVPAAVAEIRRILKPGGLLLVLGIARDARLSDSLRSLGDAVSHRICAAFFHEADVPVTVADPVLSWSETFAELRTLLPGVRCERLPLWRYLARWHKPA